MNVRWPFVSRNSMKVWSRFFKSLNRVKDLVISELRDLRFPEIMTINQYLSAIPQISCNFGFVFSQAQLFCYNSRFLLVDCMQPISL